MSLLFVLHITLTNTCVYIYNSICHQVCAQHFTRKPHYFKYSLILLTNRDLPFTLMYRDYQELTEMSKYLNDLTQEPLNSVFWLIYTSTFTCRWVCLICKRFVFRVSFTGIIECMEYLSSEGISMQLISAVSSGEYEDGACTQLIRLPTHLLYNLIYLFTQRGWT